MTSSSVTPRSRGRRLLLLTALLVLLGAAGAAAWFFQARRAVPVPPDVAPDPADPAVAVVIRRARGEVLKDPRSAEAWGDLGEAFFANELEDEGCACFAQAERLAPDDPRWPYFQAGRLLNQGQPEAALPYLEKAVALGDARGESNAVPRLFLAETLLTLGRLDEAEAQFRAVLARQPEDVRAHLGMGLLAAARQDWQTSRTHLLRCLGSPYARKRASSQLAVLSQRLGDAAGARRYRALADGLPDDQSWPDPYITEYLHWAVKKRSRYRLAESLQAVGQMAQAAAVLRSLAADYPDDYLPYVELGKVLGPMGDLAEAERAERQALRLAPGMVQPHYYLSAVVLMEGEELARRGDAGGARQRFEEAAALARQALALKPDYGYAYMIRGRALQHLGQRTEAVAALRQAVHCNPELGELHFRLGEALAEAGEQAEARHCLEQALRLGPPGAPWQKTATDLLRAAPGDKGPKRASDSVPGERGASAP